MNYILYNITYICKQKIWDTKTSLLRKSNSTGIILIFLLDIELEIEIFSLISLEDIKKSETELFFIEETFEVALRILLVSVSIFSTRLWICFFFISSLSIDVSNTFICSLCFSFMVFNIKICSGKVLSNKPELDFLWCFFTILCGLNAGRKSWII